MLTEETLTPIFTDINPHTKTVSIALDTVIKRDGEIINTSRHRRAFVPGEIQAVKDYIGVQSSPEIDYLNTIWSQEVIDAYNASLDGQI